MKKLFTVLMLAPIFAVAQKQLPIYMKIGPQAFIDKGEAPAFGGNLALGFRAGRYITVGPTVTYFKFKKMQKAVVPVGLDINVSDFEKKKIRPVFTAQLLYPVYKINSYTNGNGDYFDQKGVFMAHVAAGFAFPFNARQKLLVTGGYSRLNLKSGDGIKTGQNMAVISVAVIL